MAPTPLYRGSPSQNPTSYSVREIVINAQLLFVAAGRLRSTHTPRECDVLKLAISCVSSHGFQMVSNVYDFWNTKTHRIGSDQTMLQLRFASNQPYRIAHRYIALPFQLNIKIHCFGKWNCSWLLTLDFSGDGDVLASPRCFITIRRRIQVNRADIKASNNHRGGQFEMQNLVCLICKIVNRRNVAFEMGEARLNECMRMLKSSIYESGERLRWLWSNLNNKCSIDYRIMCCNWFWGRRRRIWEWRSRIDPI